VFEPKPVFEPKTSDISALTRLKSLLSANLGDQGGFLIFEGGKRVKLPFKISWNETLAKEINDILENHEP
jgi:hypothetical protein